MFQLDKKHQKYLKYNPTNIDWIGDIPDGWEVKKLKNSFSFEKGKNAGLYTQEYISSDENKGEYPVYSGQTGNNGVMGYINTFIYDEERAIFTTTVGAKVMTPMLLSGKFSLSQNCVLFKRTNVVDEGYFYYQLFPLFQRKIDDIPSHMQPSLRIGDLNKYLVIYPSLEEQQKITNYLDEKMALLDEVIAKKKNQIELLAEHRTALINDAIRKGLDKNIEMKDSGIEWIGKIPKEWEVKKLKWGLMTMELSHQDGNHGELHPKSTDYVDKEHDGIPFVMASNVRNGIISLDDCKYIPKSVSDALRIGFAKDGDILLTHKGTVGEVAIVALNKEFPYVMLTPQVTYYRILKKDLWDARFLKLFFQSHIFKTQIDIFCSNQSTRDYVGLLAQKNLITFKPDLKEQQKIADYLDKETKYIDDMIAKIEKSIELLEEYRTSLISHAVSGKIRVS